MKKILYILIALLIVSCQPTLIAEFEDQPVVSCYLEQGISPVLTVQKLISLRDDVEYSDEDVDKLLITITDNSTAQSYQLDALGDGQYQNSSLIIEEGGEYSLEFTYNGNLITSSTTVPTLPVNVDFSTSYIYVSTPTGPDSDSNIDVTWDNEEGDYYIVEGFTTSTNPIIEDDSTSTKSVRLSYTQGESSSLSKSSFNYYGSYEMSVLHITYEYAIYSQGTGSSSSDLVDIRGNIDGGYGIFTGIGREVKSISIK
ncbi:MAG: hypothetical protein R3Y50_07490 [Rikenellaceae bacterium]